MLTVAEIKGHRDQAWSKTDIKDCKESDACVNEILVRQAVMKPAYTAGHGNVASS